MIEEWNEATYRPSGQRVAATFQRRNAARQGGSGSWLAPVGATTSAPLLPTSPKSHSSLSLAYYISPVKPTSHHQHPLSAKQPNYKRIQTPPVCGNDIQEYSTVRGHGREVVSYELGVVSLFWTVRFTEVMMLCNRLRNSLASFVKTCNSVKSSYNPERTSNQYALSLASSQATHETHRYSSSRSSYNSQLSTHNSQLAPHAIIPAPSIPTLSSKLCWRRPFLTFSIIHPHREWHIYKFVYTNNTCTF